MKLEKYKEDSYEFTKQTSDLIRQFAFAGIAIIWIFKIDKLDGHLIPRELFIPLLFMVATLGFDLLQYLVPSIIWSQFFRIHEKRNNGNTQIDIKASIWLSRPGWLFYYLKCATLLIGYFYIINFLVQKI